jgi:hypothetical protein
MANRQASWVSQEGTACSSELESRSGFCAHDISGYYSEVVVTGDLTPRWICWIIPMVFFLYIVQALFVGLASATTSENDAVIKGKFQTAQIMTTVS